jgi:hypothetical protein
VAKALLLFGKALSGQSGNGRKSDLVVRVNESSNKIREHQRDTKIQTDGDDEE